MPTTRFTVHTSLSPSEVMGLFTDFGPDRASRWPNVDEAHFEVHDQGPDWAEVTEGNAMGWERERYSWDAAAGTVAIDTLDSNLWGPGSGWRYELTPAGRGHRRAGHVDPRAQVLPGQAHRCVDPPRRSAHARKAVPVGAAEGGVSLTRRAVGEGLARRCGPKPRGGG